MSDRRYGCWGGNPKGSAENITKCISEVHDSGAWLRRQCSRKRGFGPDGEYCKVHSKRFDPPEDETYTYKVVLPNINITGKTYEERGAKAKALIAEMYPEYKDKIFSYESKKVKGDVK